MAATPEVQANFEALGAHDYVGRGLILGQTPDGNVQNVYFITARSEGSRNRVLANDGGVVRTEVFDASKEVGDPALTLYAAMQEVADTNDIRHHVVSNGRQTDAIVDGIGRGEAFERALAGQTYEPDKPNYTSRISGITVFGNNRIYFGLSTIARSLVSSGKETKTEWHGSGDEELGIGRGIHTYRGDIAALGLPRFEGPAVELPLWPTAEETAQQYWDLLADSFRVALAVRSFTSNGEPIDEVLRNENQRTQLGQ